MAQYLVKRVLGALPVFFGITLLVFFLMNMAPATIADLAGGEDASSAAARAALEANLGLDQPLPVRYVLWLKELLTGDLGLSYRTGQPVLGMIAQRVGPSLILTGTGVAAAVVFGCLRALRAGRSCDPSRSGQTKQVASIPFMCWRRVRWSATSSTSWKRRPHR